MVIESNAALVSVEGRLNNHCVVEASVSSSGGAWPFGGIGLVTPRPFSTSSRKPPICDTHSSVASHNTRWPPPGTMVSRTRNQLCHLQRVLRRDQLVEIAGQHQSRAFDVDELLRAIEF